MVHTFALEPLWLGLFSGADDHHAFSSFGHQRTVLRTSYFVRVLLPRLPFSSYYMLLTHPSLCCLYIELMFDHAAIPHSPTKYTSSSTHAVYTKLDHALMCAYLTFFLYPCCAVPDFC